MQLFGHVMPAKKNMARKIKDSKCYPKVEQINGRMTRKWGHRHLSNPDAIEVRPVKSKEARNLLLRIILRR